MIGAQDEEDNDRRMAFRERQQFRQVWIWVLMVVTLVPTLTIVAAGFYQQVIRGRPFGDEPVSNAGLALLSAVLLVICGGVLAMMWFARLDVEVTDREIVIFFPPFHLKPRRIALADLAEAKARKYSPIGEYGGWGIRWGFQGMAYNVSGNEGVQLVLKNGKRILIGSQRSAELEKAITSRG
jgi:hypothetical protein